MLNAGVLYRLDFASGKSYIGITEGRFSTRLKNHERCARKGSNVAVHRAWRKYGHPEAKILAFVEKRLLLETEVNAIRVFDTLVPHGYNMIPGGKESPTKYPEIAARVSASLTGRVRTERHKANLRLAVRGKKLTEEHKELISKSLLGNKRASALKGRKRPPRSAEWSAKISAAHKKKKRLVDPVTKQFLKGWQLQC